MAISRWPFRRLSRDLSRDVFSVRCLLRRAFDAFRLRLGAAGRVESLLAETLRQLRQEAPPPGAVAWRPTVGQPAPNSLFEIGVV